MSSASYPMENVNVADLRGVLWYVHHEVVPGTPRKYHIDRIRRFLVRMKTTREFWNVHHRNFGPFSAFDGGRCSTPGCGDVYHQYGFVVGCQAVSLKEGAYIADRNTTTACAPGSDHCRAPLWFSLPGPCPDHGLRPADMQDQADRLSMNVSLGKSAGCLRRKPGGRCRGPGPPTGAPDCTYAVEEAGEISLDELAGIEDYNLFWNESRYICRRDVAAGIRQGPCVDNDEYNWHLDRGIGNSFWNGRLDPARCEARAQAARALFERRFPDAPAELAAPLCDFDMVYKDELSWPVNHTGAV